MKTTILSCLCAFTAFLSSANAQADTPSPGEADREALRALAARYEQAISQGNLLSLQDVVLDDASAVFITGEKSPACPRCKATWKASKNNSAKAAATR